MMSEEKQTATGSDPEKLGDSALQPSQGERLPQLSFAERVNQVIALNPKKACTSLIPLFNEKGILPSQKREALAQAVKTLASGLGSKKLEKGELNDLMRQTKIMFGLDGSAGIEPEWIVQACRELLEENPEDFEVFSRALNMRQLSELSSLLEDLDISLLTRHLSSTLAALYSKLRMSYQDQFAEVKQNMLAGPRALASFLLESIAQRADEEDGDLEIVAERVVAGMQKNLTTGRTIMMALEYLIEVEADDTGLAQMLLDILRPQSASMDPYSGE